MSDAWTVGLMRVVTRDEALALYSQPAQHDERVALFDFMLWLARNPLPGDAARRACFQNRGLP